MEKKQGLFDFRSVEIGETLTYLPHVPCTTANARAATVIGVYDGMIVCTVKNLVLKNESRTTGIRFQRTSGLGLKGESFGFLVRWNKPLDSTQAMTSFCDALSEALNDPKLDSKVQRAISRLLGKKPRPSKAPVKGSNNPFTRGLRVSPARAHL